MPLSSDSPSQLGSSAPPVVVLWKLPIDRARDKASAFEKGAP